MARSASEVSLRLAAPAMALAMAMAPPAGAHDWYSGLRSPTGLLCCNERDCRPVPYRVDPESGREEIMANGAWYPVEYDKVLGVSSPDGGSHACWSNSRGRPRFRCIILPGFAALGQGVGSAAVNDVPNRAAAPLETGM